MKHRGPSALTVGSLRGQPQSVLATPRRVAYAPTGASSAEAKPRRCCGGGCADCPVGRRIRARMGLPVTE